MSVTIKTNSKSTSTSAQNPNVIDMKKGEYLSDIVKAIITKGDATAENPYTINFYNHSKTMNWSNFTEKILFPMHVYLVFQGEIKFWDDSLLVPFTFSDEFITDESKTFLGFSFNRENDDQYKLLTGLQDRLVSICFSGFSDFAEDYNILMSDIDNYGNSSSHLVFAGGDSTFESRNSKLYKKLADNTLIDVTADFSFANLALKNLSYSFFLGANLSSANFYGANCQKANFTHANCQSANFERADC